MLWDSTLIHYNREKYKYMTLVHRACLCQSTGAMDSIFVFVLDAKNMLQRSGRCDQLTSFLASHCSSQTLIFNLIKWGYYMVIFILAVYSCMHLRIWSLKKYWYSFFNKIASYFCKCRN